MNELPPPTIYKQIPSEQLTHFILVHGRCYVEHRQVSLRLKELLYQKHQTLHQQFSPLKKTLRTERQSYLCQEYIDYVEHLLEISYLSLRSKVAYECGHMLLQARQSIKKNGR